MIEGHLASLYSSKAIAGVVLICLLMVSQSSQQKGDQIHTNYQVTSTNNKDSLKIGNTKTQNFNIRQDSYVPTQLTQVVLNVPKLKKTLRKSRPPTEEEFLIKRKILDVYEEAKREVASEQQPESLDHLGRIIQSLNPKYVATERVRRVAFADPADPDGGVSEMPPLSDTPAQSASELTSSEPLPDQLVGLSERLRELIHWDQKFIELLATSSDEQLSPEQIAIKRLLLCMNDPSACNRAHPLEPVSAVGVEQQVVKQEEPVYTSESSTESYDVDEDEDKDNEIPVNERPASLQNPVHKEPTSPQVPVYEEPASLQVPVQMQPVAAAYEEQQPEYQQSPYLGMPIEPPAIRAQRFIQQNQQPRVARPQTNGNFQPIRREPVFYDNMSNNFDHRFAPRQPAFASRPAFVGVQQQQQQRQPQPQRRQVQYNPVWQQRQPVQPYMRY